MKRPRKDGLCTICHERPALFKRRGVVKRDRDHNVCLQCFRSLDNRNRAMLIAGEENGEAEHTDLGRSDAVQGLREAGR
jgi:hypothetical protein